MRPAMAVAALALCGCASWRPQYPAVKTPVVATRPDWFNPKPPSEGADPEAAGQWWTTFNDPVLSGIAARILESNLDAKIAAARIAEARAGESATKAGLLPSIGGSGGFTRVRGGIAQGLTRSGIPSGSPQSRSTVLAPFETNVFQASFDSTWELDLLGGVRQSIAASQGDVRAAGEARHEVLVSVLGEAGRAYMQLRGAQKRLAVLEDNIAAQREILNLTRVKSKAGLAPELDAIRISAQLSESEAGRSPLKASISQNIRKLSVLAGLEPAALEEELRAPREIPAIPAAIPAGLPSDLLSRRPDVRRAEAEISAQTARVGVAMADMYPKFSLTGLAGRQGTEVSGLSLGAGNFFSFGPGVRLPIFTGGRLRANKRLQDARLEGASLEYERTVLNALEEVEGGLSAFAREKERQEQLAAALVHARDAERLSTELYSKGLGDFLTVLDAQRARLVIEDELAQSQTNVAVNLVALYKALGGGWRN